MVFPIGCFRNQMKSFIITSNNTWEDPEDWRRVNIMTSLEFGKSEEPKSAWLQ